MIIEMLVDVLGVNLISNRDIPTHKLTISNICAAKCIETLNKLFILPNKLDSYKALNNKITVESFRNSIRNILATAEVSPNTINTKYNYNEDLKTFNDNMMKVISKADESELLIALSTREKLIENLQFCISQIKEIIRLNLQDSLQQPIAQPTSQQSIQQEVVESHPLIQIVPNVEEPKISLIDMIPRQDTAEQQPQSQSSSVNPKQLAQQQYEEAVAKELLQNQTCLEFATIPKEDWSDKIKNIPQFQENVINCIEETKKIIPNTQFLYAIFAYTDENNFILRRLVETPKGEIVFATAGKFFLEAICVNGQIQIKQQENTNSPEAQMALMMKVFPNASQVISTQEDLTACIKMANYILNDDQYNKFSYEFMKHDNGMYIAKGPNMALGFNPVDNSIGLCTSLK